MISYKLNEKDSVFAISNNDTNYNFTLNLPKFDTEKETSTSLRCVTYAIDYSNIYYRNITDRKPLPNGSWALRITSYVTIHVSTWNQWLHGQSMNERNKF